MKKENKEHIAAFFCYIAILLFCMIGESLIDYVLKLIML